VDSSGGDHGRRRRTWRLNWDRLSLVAFLALQVTIVVAFLAAIVAIVTH
jgi:hypothetical protein